MGARKRGYCAALVHLKQSAITTPHATNNDRTNKTPEATRRGLGAALLRKPQKLARLVSGIVQASDLPVTVKIRTGENDDKINAAQVAALLEAAGAAAVTIHGRTMEQRWVTGGRGCNGGGGAVMVATGGRGAEGEQAGQGA